MTINKDMKKRAKKARKTVESETTAARAAFFFVGAAGTVAGFIVGRRNRAAIRHASDVAKGVAHKATPGSDSSAGSLNDPALAQKVESEIFRDADAPKGSVVVNAENGLVYLRGQVDSQEQIEQLVAKAGRVDGVRCVESLLHTPGSPAPMKS